MPGKVDPFLLQSNDDTRKFKLSLCLVANNCYCRVCNGVMNKGELRIGPEKNSPHIG